MDLKHVREMPTDAPSVTSSSRAWARKQERLVSMTPLFLLWTQEPTLGDCGGRTSLGRVRATRTHLPSAVGGVEGPAWQVELHGALRGFVAKAPGEVWGGAQWQVQGEA